MMELIILTFLLLCAIYGALFLDKDCYVYVHEHKMWKLWKYYISNVDHFQYSHEVDGCHVFVWDDVYAIVWEDGLCSIHTDDKCIVSTWYERKSFKMAKLLITKLEE